MMGDGVLDRFSMMPSTSERIAALLNCEDLSDVTFLVGTDGNHWRYPAHKFVLALASPVFRTMFASDLSEGKLDAKVVVTDVHPSAFENVLQYIYTNRPHFNGVRVALDTLYAAHKYMLYHLATLCMDFLASHVECDNVLEILMEIKLYDVELNKGKLLIKCLRLLDREATQVLASQTFGNLDFSTLKMILRREFLNVQSEVQVFDAISYWALQECRRQKLELSAQNKRSVLGKALHLVQYLAMTREEFVDGPANSGLLNEDECRGLLAKIYGDDEVNLPAQLRRQYLKWKRLPYECYPVKFYRKEPSTIVSSRQEQTVIIATNRDIVLIGFDLYGIGGVEDGHYCNGLHLTVTDKSGNVVGKTQWKVGQKVPLKENNKLFVEFPEGVFLKSRKKYKVQLCLPKGEYLLGDNWEGTTTSKYKCRSIDFAVKYCKTSGGKDGDDSDDESFAELDNNSDDDMLAPAKASPATTEEKAANPVNAFANADPEEVFVRSHFQGVKFYF